MEVVENASSLDMRNVLSAFSRMIISLRFGSDTYVLGDLTKAQSVFQDALDLFKSINNSRGIAIANNNLGTVMLKSGHFEPAKRHLSGVQRWLRYVIVQCTINCAATIVFHLPHMLCENGG